jgi:ketosteroid isomerase-like protein
MTTVSTEDQLAICDLFVSFCYAADALGDGTEIAALFSDDAVYDLTGFGLYAFTGRPAIHDFFRTSFAATRRNVHFISNIKVQIGASSTASASAYVHAFSEPKDGDKIELRARYDVDVVKSADGWQFSRMGIELLRV